MTADAQTMEVPAAPGLSRGDLLATLLIAGLGGIFPEDLPVGTIVSVENGKSPFFKTIHIEPFVDFGALDELIILKRSED